MSLKSRIQRLEPIGGARYKVVSAVPYGETDTGQREPPMTAEEWERRYGALMTEDGRLDVKRATREQLREIASIRIEEDL